MKQVGMILRESKLRPLVQVWTKQDYGYLLTDTTWGKKELKLLQSDIDAIIGDKGNGYTTWAATGENYQGELTWENMTAQTANEKIGVTTEFNRRGTRAKAILLVPPKPMVPALMFMAEKQEYFDDLHLSDVFHQTTDTFNVFRDDLFPTVKLTKTEQSDSTLLITATASVNLTGSELYWETTAGTLDRARSVFNGKVATVLLEKPKSQETYKVKCGFKYFSGISQIEL